MSLHPLRRVRVVTLVALLSALLLTVLQLPPTAWTVARAEMSPTITSDRADYPAGATVVLSGTGWKSGESVQIVVDDTIGSTWQHSSTVTAAADGTVTDSFTLPPFSVSSYEVVATGALSGVATTTFTDAPAAVDLQQCRNGTADVPHDCVELGGSDGWVTGNVGASQAHMLEGYSTPFRAVMTNLPVNTPITLVIGYDIRDSGANAYDFLTHYQRLEPHSYFGHSAETVDPTSGVVGQSATTSTFPIPAPSSVGSPVAGQPTTAFNSLPADERAMTLFGGAISAMSYVSQGSLTAGSSETQISVTFTTDEPTAVLAWGGHISECAVWGTTDGTCNSAGGISGSPYHMRLISWGPDLPNLGNTDRSMAAAVVVQPGNLTLAKALTGGPLDYTGPFTIGYDCGTGYIGSVQVSAGGSQTVNGIPSGSVCTISETPPTPPGGYSFGTPTFSPSDTVTIGEGTTVTVTTNNSLARSRGSLTIAKTLSNVDGAVVPASFSIAYDCGGSYTGSVAVAAGGSVVVSGIPTGSTCTVSEAALAPIPGYTWGTASVTPGSVVIADETGVFTLTVANSITRDRGSLVLVKSLIGGPDGYTGPFSLEYDCGDGYSGSVEISAGGSATVSGIPTGSVCIVSEPTLPTVAGYDFDTASFSPSSTATIASEAGSSITVTTTNTLVRTPGTLTIMKSLSNPSGAPVPTSFSIDYDCGNGFSGSVSVAAGGSATVPGVPAGSVCTVSEAELASIPGYTWGTASVDPVSVMVADATGVFTLMVENTISMDTGSLRITKMVRGLIFVGSFDIEVDCSGDGGSYLRSIAYPTPGSVTIDGIPAGSTCTVTELTQPSAPAFHLWDAPMIDGSPVLIIKDSVVDVIVTNPGLMIPVWTG